MHTLRSLLTSSGTITVDTPPDGGIAAVMQKVEEALRHAKATRLRVTSDSITFRGGPFRGVTNWNILLPISSGELRFTRCDRAVLVHYHISWLGLSLVTVALVTIALIFSGFGSALALLIPFAWLFYLLGDYTIAVDGFPQFLASAAGGRSSRPVSPPIGSPFGDY